jgi:hypothetical protein
MCRRNLHGRHTGRLSMRATGESARKVAWQRKVFGRKRSRGEFFDHDADPGGQPGK